MEGEEGSSVDIQDQKLQGMGPSQHYRPLDRSCLLYGGLARRITDRQLDCRVEEVRGDYEGPCGPL